MPKFLDRALLGAASFAILIAQGCASMKSASTPTAANETSSADTSDGAKKPLISATKLAKQIFIGQVYPSGAVYLDVTEDRAEGKKRWPKSIRIFSLHKGPIDSSGLPATLIGPLEHVYPPEAEMMVEKSSECSAPKYHQDPALNYESPPSSGIRDYYDRGTIDNCSSYNVAKYFLSEKVSKAFPVFAVADYEVKNVDYSAMGQVRPLSSSEKREVSQFHLSDDEEDKKNSHFLEAAQELVTLQIPAAGFWARLSTFENDRGEQRTRTLVLDIMEKTRVRKRHLRSHFKGSL